MEEYTKAQHSGNENLQNAIYNEIVANLDNQETETEDIKPFIENNILSKCIKKEENEDPRLRDIMNDHNYMLSDDRHAHCSQDIRQNLINLVKTSTTTSFLKVDDLPVEKLIDTVLNLLTNVVNYDLVIDKITEVSHLNEIIKKDPGVESSDNSAKESIDYDASNRELADLKLDLDLYLKEEPNMENKSLLVSDEEPIAQKDDNITEADKPKDPVFEKDKQTNDTNENLTEMEKISELEESINFILGREESDEMSINLNEFDKVATIEEQCNAIQSNEENSCSTKLNLTEIDKVLDVSSVLPANVLDNDENVDENMEQLESHTMSLLEEFSSFALNNELENTNGKFKETLQEPALEEPKADSLNDVEQSCEPASTIPHVSQQSLLDEITSIALSSEENTPEINETSTEPVNIPIEIETNDKQDNLCENTNATETDSLITPPEEVDQPAKKVDNLKISSDSIETVQDSSENIAIPIISVNSEDAQTISEPCASTQPSENIEISNQNENISNDISSQDNTVSQKPTEFPDVINDLQKFAEQLKTDCTDSLNNPNFNLEQFLALKLREHKAIINSILFKDSTIQTEKVITKKKLRKINAQDKRRLLESSNDSDSSISSCADKSPNKLGSENQSKKNSSSSDSSMKSLDLKRSTRDTGFFRSVYDSDDDESLKSDLSQSNESLGSLSKSESDTGDQNERSDVEKKNVGKITTGEKQDTTSNTSDDKCPEKNKNESDKENRSSQDEDNQEKEIERLLNLKGLAEPQKNTSPINSSRANKNLSKSSSKTDKLYKVMQDIDSHSMSDCSFSEESEPILTEKQFLVKCNENLKQQLLNSASSDSENSDAKPDIDLIKKLNEHSSDEDDQRISYVDKFLETLTDNDDNSSVNNEPSKEPTPDKTIEKTKLDLSSDVEEILPTTNTLSDHDDSFGFKRKEGPKKSFETILANDTRQRALKMQEDLIELSADSSDSDIEELSTEAKEKSQRIKPMLRQDQLESETIHAQKKEAIRVRRLEKRNNFLSKMIKSQSDNVNEKDLVLDYSSTTKRFIKVHSEIVKHLKPHQRDGVKFMYDCCYGCVDSVKDNSGSGCILAHCMGLGKTLQIIALLHTVTSHKELKTSKILVLCPKSTIMNWADEIQRWLRPLEVKNLQIFNFSDTADIYEKIGVLRRWSLSSTKAGCLIMGYEAFRSLVFFNTSKTRVKANMRVEDIRDNIKKYLLKPGADLVVCDEGHIIKNRRSGISLAAAEIVTPKRIILTGTPIQNNLKEYYAMVNFIKPLILGTEKEFANLYANPIKNGQHKDSSKRDIKVMKQRSFVLHKKLSKFVQRKEAELLQSFLPQKFEYVLFIPMTDVQMNLYEYVLEALSRREDSRGKSLITDYTCLRKIWTHPKVLEDAWKNAIAAKNKKEPKRQTSSIAHSDDDQPDDIYDSQTGVISVQHDWWRSLVTETDLESILPSNKLKTMFEIIRMAEENGEKCLIFSAFVAVLNVVEYFFNKINDKQRDFFLLDTEKPTGNWINGQDYYRLDGKTNKTLRHQMVKRFNDPKNKRTRVFLISARAGGQGINLIGANRVIILDTSWNPANDQQNIFRIFRLGQKRNCYIYRLIAMGTMEEKVYSRSVTKQAMSFRVVDEQQIDRHYNMAELAELYTLTKPSYSERPVPVFPQDQILANLLLNFPDLVYKYHEHDSLLENKVEQELSEQEKADAWVAYERDLQINSEPRETMEGFQGYPLFNQGNFMMPPMADYDAKNYLPSFDQSQMLPNYFVNRNSYLDILNMYKNLSSSLLGDKSGRAPPYNPNFGLPLTSAMMGNSPMCNTLPSSENHLSALANPYFPYPNTSLNPNAMLSNANIPSSSQTSADRLMTNEHSIPSSMRNFPLPMTSFTKDLPGRSPKPKTIMQSPTSGSSSSPIIRSPTGQIPQNIYNTSTGNDSIPRNVITKKFGKVNTMPAPVNNSQSSETIAKLKAAETMLRTPSPKQNPSKSESNNRKFDHTNPQMPVNMGIVYPKPIPVSLSPASDNTEVTCITKPGSSMQIIPTHSPLTENVRKKFDNISPNISLTAVRTIPKASQPEQKESRLSHLDKTLSNIRKRRNSFDKDKNSPGLIEKSPNGAPSKMSKY